MPATRWLGRKPVDITLIDRRNHHLFQPLLYQVATGLAPPGQISPGIRRVVRKHKNVRVECAEVTGFDLARRIVHAAVLGVDARDSGFERISQVGGSELSRDTHPLAATSIDSRRVAYRQFDDVPKSQDQLRSRVINAEVRMSEVTDVVDAQVDAYFARDLERFAACYAPDVVITNAAGEVRAEGHDALRQMYGRLFENSPELAGRIANRIVVGNFVADHEEIDGFGGPDSRNPVQAIAVYQVTDGKISRVALYV